MERYRFDRPKAAVARKDRHQRRVILLAFAKQTLDRETKDVDPVS
jgi:hypothetical protein